MSELWKKINNWKKNCFEIWEKPEKVILQCIYVISIFFVYLDHFVTNFHILYGYRKLQTCRLHLFYPFWKISKNEGSRAKKVFFFLVFLTFQSSFFLQIFIFFHSYIICKNRLKDERATQNRKKVNICKYLQKWRL